MRLQSILAEVINHDQSAFLPMCFILDNILLTHETISHAQHSSQPLLFLKLEFSKAYDWVDLHFLFQAMQAMGFPNEFTAMTHLLFTGAREAVSVNGRVTSHFEVRQGVRQRYPLAPYLFIIMGEVHNHSLKREVAQWCLQGISLLGTLEPQLILQYADDTSMTFSGEEVGVTHAIDTIRIFSFASGLLHKSRGYW